MSQNLLVTDHFVCVPSQCETALQCISRRLDAHRIIPACHKVILWPVTQTTQNYVYREFMFDAYNPYIWERSLQWRHNGRDSVSNHRPHDCLLNRVFGRRSKKTSKLRITGLCTGHSPGTGEFPAQIASNAENVSIWWRHRVYGV